MRRKIYDYPCRFQTSICCPGAFSSAQSDWHRVGADREFVIGEEAKIVHHGNFDAIHGGLKGKFIAGDMISKEVDVLRIKNWKFCHYLQIDRRKRISG